MHNPFKRLIDAYQGNRMLCDAIAEQSASLDELKGRLRVMRAENDQLTRALNAQADKLTAARTEKMAATLEASAAADKLARVTATMEHAQHCYEQCEADRQALANERDAVRAERDEALAVVGKLKEGICELYCDAANALEGIAKV